MFQRVPPPAFDEDDEESVCEEDSDAVYVDAELAELVARLQVTHQI